MIETTHMTTKQSPWRNPWVIGWLAIVLAVLLANSIMIYLAFDANPGLVVEDYYERGQHYEKNMLARLAKNPGWQMQVDVPVTPSLGAPALIKFTVAKKDGTPVRADSIIFHAYRPSDAKQDFSVPMQQMGAGNYQAEVTFKLKGVWDALVSVQKDGEEYNEAVRIMVAPKQ